MIDKQGIKDELEVRNNRIGRAVRARRTILGMSQLDLGAKIGVTFQQMQKYERGLNRVSAATLEKLASIMGVSVGFFYEEVQGEQKGSSRKSVALMKDYYKCDEVGQDVVETVARKLANGKDD